MRSERQSERERRWRANNSADDMLNGGAADVVAGGWGLGRRLKEGTAPPSFWGRVCRFAARRH